VFEKGGPGSGEAARIAQLEQMVGKLKMQLEIAKKKLALARWDVAQKRQAVMRLRE
jgi:hypothetical protein